MASLLALSRPLSALIAPLAAACAATRTALLPGTGCIASLLVSSVSLISLIVRHNLIYLLEVYGISAVTFSDGNERANLEGIPTYSSIHYPHKTAPPLMLTISPVM